MSDKKKKSGSEKEKKSSAKSKDKDRPRTDGAPPADAAGGSGVSPASMEFEAGLLFSKYDKENTGVVTAEDFRKLMMEYSTSKSTAAPVVPAGSTPALPTAAAAASPPAAAAKSAPYDPTSFSFEAGKIFAQFDRGDGRIDKQAFENMLLSHPGLLGAVSPPTRPLVQPSAPSAFDGPSRSLTHYDETAGVAIPASSVAAHQAMGNSVVPLVESYSTRYSRLRTMLTAKLLPKREHLLQLRRQLQVTSVEVEAVKKGIENETLSDTQQILDRLKHIESLRQSAIQHQILQVEKELQAIDRVVQRVEAANQISPFSGASTFSGLSVLGSSPTAAPITSASGQAISSMVEIIQQYGELSATVDRLATKQIVIQNDFRTDDFPKETSDRLEVVARCDKYMHAIAVKDQMLWVAMQEKKKAEESLEEERKLCQEYALEIAQWADMSQQMATQIRNEKSENEVLQRRVEELMNVLRDNRIFVENS